MHQGGAFRLRLKPDEVQWVYDNLVTLIFDSKVSRVIVVQSKAAFIARHPEWRPQTFTKNLRLLTWETFLSAIEQRLLDESYRSERLVTGLIYFDGAPDRHVAQIVNRYARKYDQERSYAGAGIVESPIFVDSKASKMIQLADVLAYSTHYIHRTENPIESFIRIGQETVTHVIKEVIYPIT
ncbi:MAG: DUF3800 domain-containing protein [Caldilinea sp. CFX5]|nr:DUF3800 domain-containing protein [Caldilinea sp. CFX5]